MHENLYNLQAKCERIAERARKTEIVEARLARAAKRFEALQATLTAERRSHELTRSELKATRKMAAAMARRING